MTYVPVTKSAVYALRRQDWSLVVFGHLLVRRFGDNCRRIETCIDEAEHRVTEAHSPNPFVNLMQANRLAREGCR